MIYSCFIYNIYLFYYLYILYYLLILYIYNNLYILYFYFFNNININFSNILFFKFVWANLQRRRAKTDPISPPPAAASTCGWCSRSSGPRAAPKAPCGCPRPQWPPPRLAGHTP